MFFWVSWVNKVTPSPCTKDFVKNPSLSMFSLLFSKFGKKPSVGTGTDSDAHGHKSQASGTDTTDRLQPGQQPHTTGRRCRG